MKKIYSLAIATVLTSGAAFAGPGMNHNNMNNNTVVMKTMVEPVVDTVVTVNQIPNMMDNQNVVMTGYIIEDLGDKMYVFQDSTGTIAVEIEPMLIQEMMITPNTKMKIKGELDKGDNDEIDVIEVDYISAM